MFVKITTLKLMVLILFKMLAISKILLIVFLFAVMLKCLIKEIVNSG